MLLYLLVSINNVLFLFIFLNSTDSSSKMACFLCKVLWFFVHLNLYASERLEILYPYWFCILDYLGCWIFSLLFTSQLNFLFSRVPICYLDLFFLEDFPFLIFFPDINLLLVVCIANRKISFFSLEPHNLGMSLD